MNEEHELLNWKYLVNRAQERVEDSKQGKISKQLNLKSRNLIYENMRKVYGPMIVGLNIEIHKKRKTLWYIVSVRKPIENRVCHFAYLRFFKFISHIS